MSAVMTVALPPLVARPKQPWMPAMFEVDTQGLPVRHRPGTRRHGDVWESRCGGVWLFNFIPLAAVMALRPCPRCEGFEP